MAIGFVADITPIVCLKEKYLSNSNVIVRDVCTYLRELGYKKVRIGVDKENPQSNSFWCKNGFRIISEKEYNVMELVL